MSFWLRKERAEHMTWWQRHDRSSQIITQQVKGKKEAIAWVIGLGGWKRNREFEPPIQRFFRDLEQRLGRWTGNEFTPIHPTEHVEVAEALNKGKTQFQVHAIEVDTQSHEMAKTDLIGRRIPTRQIQNGILKEVIKPVPEHIANRIVFHGPGPAGNVFNTLPRKRPDVVTVFNLPGYYSEQEQTRLAEHLAGSLKPGGLILTNVRGQEEFVERLDAKLEKHVVELNQFGEPRIVAFRKPEQFAPASQ